MAKTITTLVFGYGFLLSCIDAAVPPGGVVCRYNSTTGASVNYYTCTLLALSYPITLEKFFELNPTVDKTCDNIKANTDYCVRGYVQGYTSQDGFCGPSHGNTTCLDTDKPCCNSETWKCGSLQDDCIAGTCYSGGCLGNPSKYSLDGKCGIQNDNKLCSGKWGDCCNASGQCGTGNSFCGEGICQSGNCTGSSFPNPGQPPSASPVTTPGLPTPTPGSVSPDGSCGSTNKFTCKSSAFGDCCSSAGFCGSTSTHCTAGCQAAFGICTNSDLSPDGTCGGSSKYKCKDSMFGDCCSSSGYCGSTTGHCTAGCQVAFGTCTTTDLSPDGTCGGVNMYKCKGTSFGDCCSSAGYCGSSTAHCGPGCQSSFGECSAVVSSKTSNTPPIPTDVSSDGTCGGAKGMKCQGSTFGSCCSSNGFCGTGVNFCAQGCQRFFSGGCLTSNVPSLNGDCGASKGGFTCAGGPFNSQCCSAGGYCGTTDGHCKSGCQKAYGTCK